jgi:hypothetical protein
LYRFCTNDVFRTNSRFSIFYRTGK